MKKTILTLILTGLISVSAAISVSAQVSTHSIWTNNNGGRQVNDPDLGCEYTSFHKFRMITSWTEPTPGYAAQAHFRGAALIDEEDPCSGGHFYEFTLNQSTVTSIGTIQGYWDVYRDGVLMCSACTGQVSGLSQPITNYYKLTINDPVYGPGAWFYSGFIDVRDDF
jgi:hypothetical protein